MAQTINLEIFKDETCKYGFRNCNMYGLRNKTTKKVVTDILYEKLESCDTDSLCFRGYDDSFHLGIRSCNWEGLYILEKYYSDESESYMYLLDSEGTRISDCYMYISPLFVCGLCRVCSQGKDGYIDITGKKIIDLIDNFYVTNFYDDNAIWLYDALYYRDDKLDYYKDTDCFYTCYHRDFSADGLAAVRFRQKNRTPYTYIYGYINTRGEIAITPQYDKADDFINGKALVWLGGEEFYIDKKGKII